MIGYSILIVLLIVLVASCLIAMRSFRWETFGEITLFCSGMALIVAMILIPIYHIGINGEIQEFKSVQSTIKSARLNGNSIENTALQFKVIDSNRWLASVQYYDSIFDLWVPDNVNNIKPIK